MDKNNIEQAWISLILRVAMGLLFAMATIAKFVMGLSATSGLMVSTFKDTWLPLALVVPYTYVLPFAEALIAVWLLTGIKLRAAWIFTSLVLLTLSFGLFVAKQTSVSDIYVYLIISCVGLYFSKYDKCVLGGKCK